MFNSDDTIAAISTPHGTGGVGIVRISGSESFNIAKKIFRGKKDFDKIKSHTINYGKIVNIEDGQIIDEVLLSKMKNPNTFTREDIIEINCHGGINVVKRVLELVLKNGARIANPGEFTKRAFLNGRIDLSQAEAVIDIINAKTDMSSKIAIDQLEGQLSKKLKMVREVLIDLIAHIEVTVDYPEHDIEEITGQQVMDGLESIKIKLKDILKGYEKGRIIREGIEAVIVGKPNVGKSSLLNELTGKNRAIVTDIPGTTRDVIEEYVNIEGIPVRILDTAGIRNTNDVVEKIGVEKSKKAIASADFIIFIIDLGSGISPEDKEIIKNIEGIKSIIILNKADLVDDKTIKDIKNTLVSYEPKDIITISLKKEIGIEKIGKRIAELFLEGEVKNEKDVLVTNVRHKILIDKALTCIEEALNSFNTKMPLDCITIDIINAADCIAMITGESVSEDVMNQIFNRFCLGK